MRSKTSWILLFITVPCWAQTDQGLAAILARLDKLEQQNRELMQEVQALRQQLASQKPRRAPRRRLRSVSKSRNAAREDLAQTKVEASQRLPISITGMLLFNTFWNGRFSGAQDNPTVASLNPTPRTAGATLGKPSSGSNSKARRPCLGAQVNGSLYMDFYANPVSTFGLERAVSNNLSRLDEAACRDSRARLGIDKSPGRTGQADPVAARAEFAGAGRSFPADRRRQSMALAAPGPP